jgi:phytoene dehydrogenase-like protein
LFASVGSLSDKWKIFKLNRALKGKSLETIFESESKSTLTYLKDKGFSEKIVSQFFSPFFSGIFLEPDLKTSSRMFEFVYKMFGEGLAVLPKSGIGAISEQLKSQLKHTEIKFNTKVKAVGDNYILTENDEKIPTHFTIIATEAAQLVSNLNNQHQKWKSCDNLYFEVEKRGLSKPLIGLVADKNAWLIISFITTVLKPLNRDLRNYYRLQ